MVPRSEKVVLKMRLTQPSTVEISVVFLYKTVFRSISVSTCPVPETRVYGRSVYLPGSAHHIVEATYAPGSWLDPAQRLYFVLQHH